MARNQIIIVPTATVTDAATTNIDIVTLSASYDLLSITALVSNVSGTSAGTLTLQGSFDDTNWVFVNGVGAGVLTASPKASITGADLNQITITDALVANWVVSGNPYKYYRIEAKGTGTQSTEVDILYKYV